MGILPSAAENRYANRKERSKPLWFWQFIVMGLFVSRCARLYANLQSNLQKRKTQSRLAYLSFIIYAEINVLIVRLLNCWI